MCDAFAAIARATVRALARWRATVVARSGSPAAPPSSAVPPSSAASAAAKKNLATALIAASVASTSVMLVSRVSPTRSTSRVAAPSRALMQWTSRVARSRGVPPSRRAPSVLTSGAASSYLASARFGSSIRWLPSALSSSARCRAASAATLATSRSN